MHWASLWCLWTVAVALDTTGSYVEMDLGVIPHDETKPQSHERVARYYAKMAAYYITTSAAGKSGVPLPGLLGAWASKVNQKMEQWRKGGYANTTKSEFAARLKKLKAEDEEWYYEVYSVDAFAFFLDTKQPQFKHKQGSCWLATRLLGRLGGAGVEGAEHAGEWATELFSASTAALEHDIPGMKEVKVAINVYYAWAHGKRAQKLGLPDEEVQAPVPTGDDPSQSKDFCKNVSEETPTGMGAFAQSLVRGISYMEGRKPHMPVQETGVWLI
jgi:hypothetical protein